MAIVDDSDALRQSGYLAQYMTGHENCDAILFGQADQQFPYFHYTGRIQAVGGFIQDQ